MPPPQIRGPRALEDEQAQRRSIPSEWWSRAAVACAILAGVLMIGLQVRQSERTQQAFAGVRELREARLDLSKGFLHLTQIETPDAPYSREQGLALVEQAVRRMQRELGPAEGDTAQRFATRAAAFGTTFEKWKHGAMPGGAADLRAEFYALEREADAMDRHLQAGLSEIAERNRREFTFSALAAGALLAIFCIAVVRVQGARKRAEAELRNREQRLRRMADSLPQLVWTWTPDGRCDYLSRRWVNYTGRDEAGQLGDNWLEQMAAGDREKFLTKAQAAMEAGRDFQFQARLRRHDGHLRWFDLRMVPLLDSEGALAQWLGSATDVQEDHELHDLIEQERSFSAAMLDSLPGIFYLYDSAGKFLRWNLNFERVTGFDAREIAGMHPLDFFTGEDKARVAQRIDEVYRLGEASVEAEFTAKNGRTLPYFFTGMRIRHGGRECLLGTGIDISERKRAEQHVRDLNAQLERRVEQRTTELAAKNRELEMFTYSVSHDLKAPLRGIDGYSRLLLEDYSDRLDDEGRRFLASVRQASTHMGQLIDDLLAYSRLERRAALPTRLVPRALVESVLTAVWGEIDTRGVRVAVRLPDEVELLGDLQAMTMAVRNLVDNALKFTRSRSVAEIEIGARREGDNGLLWVKDNGIGFEARFHDRIFEIFQRLHRSEEYPGTGIGLAIVRKAMERMGGRVWAESTPGVGSTFFLEIPLFHT